MVDQESTATCVCRKQSCWRGSDEGIPAYCQANRFLEEIEKTKRAYLEPETIDLYRAACVVGAVNDGYRPRIEEALDFARQMKFYKVGFAACTAFSAELKVITKLFAGAGLEVVSASCAIGRVSAENRGLPELGKYLNSGCNPLAQASILNKAGTQLNFILGLCMGHDILFSQHSKAPVSTLIVKDRLLGNNPAAALYAYHARRTLFGLRRSDNEMV
jgi:uncharacterized metal-binding protein